MNLNQETAGYIKTEDCGDSSIEAYEVEDCAKSNPNPEAYRDAEAYRTYLRMTRTLEDGAKLTLTPYARSNDMTFRMHFLPTNPIEENSHTSVGLQTSYARSTAGVDYVAGIDVELTEGELSEVQTEDNAYSDEILTYAKGTHYDFDVDAQVIAPYLHAVWGLGNNTELTTGVRFELTEYDYTNNTETGGQGRLYRPASRSDDFSDISPKIGLVHALADNRRVFANLARAARAPQVTDLYRLRDKDGDGSVAEVNDIDSEILDSLEIGYRAIYPSASYELAAFVMQKENYHFRDGNDYYETDAETEHYGLELSLEWLLANNLQLVSNLTYAKHEYAFNRTVGGGNPAETVTDGDAIDGPHIRRSSTHP
jgi:iron complex outermembrane receptor protein